MTNQANHDTQGADMTAGYRLIEVKPVTGSFGAEIVGADLGQAVSPELHAEINQALLNHGVIFFRDQDITPAQHVAFAKLFGELDVHPFIPNLEGYPEIIALGGKAPGLSSYARNANVWHTDLTYRQDPPIIAILHGLEVPESGGDTMFADLCAAYDGLSDTVKAMLDGLVAVHSITQTKRTDELSSIKELKALVWSLENVPPAEHPLICTHPETGRKILYVNQHFTAYLKDMHEHESKALLEMLKKHTNLPEYQCRFRWQKNSIAMWDNRRTQHYAVADYNQIRRMHRVTVCGPRPR
ncbi:MAG: TauD/TfdA family dioxygenase [Gammaproteobacteria bacterium]|jgi:taurine dioxygenase|nr:TauD/TfdA family dioxygenase [Gammaproteobacteria bacterium]MDP6694175.1 TauD/TfdA family dioxygenase [Gammaproteobacteria bacterium]